MFFDFPITTSANTAKANAISTVLDLTAGIIYQVDVLFPGGAAGLLHVQIFNGITQVWPSNPGESFYSDQEKITFSEAYTELQTPFILTAKTWNLDDTYDHTVRLRFAVSTPLQTVTKEKEAGQQVTLSDIETQLAGES